MNITALNNITPYTVNNTLINNSENIASNLVQNANQTSGGYFGLGIMMVTFLVLLIMLMTENDVFRLDFISALAFSSGVSLLIGITLLIGDLASSFQHVMWFAIIFIIAIVSKYYQKGG